MTGRIDRIPNNDGKPLAYAFIRRDGVSYFLHCSNFQGPWNELIHKASNGGVDVEFEVENGPKGPRAINCKYTY